MKIPLLTLEAPHPDRKGSLGLHSFLLLPESICNDNNTPEVPGETMWTSPYVTEGDTEDQGGGHPAPGQTGMTRVQTL